MKKFRKFLCLMLVLTLLAMAAVPFASARSITKFTDAASIRNQSAVQMLCDLGLISGYDDGGFHPKSSITRAEVAKLIAMLATDTPTANSTVSFSDAKTSWALPYISYCAGQSIICGYDGSFYPSKSVTGRELAKMLLVMLGHDASRYVGGSWAEMVDMDATACGIYDGFTASASNAINRDNACLLIYNALRCPVIVDPDGVDFLQYALDDLMNPESYLQYRYGLAKYTAVLTGNECADLTATGSALAAGETKLENHKSFSISSDLSLVGQYVDIYMKDGVVVGKPYPTTDEFYHICDSLSEFRSVTNVYKVDDDTQFYLNYEVAGKEVLEGDLSNAKFVVIDDKIDSEHLIADRVLVLTGKETTVTSVSPLKAEGREVTAFDTDTTYTVGQTVLLIEICGKNYIV